MRKIGRECERGRRINGSKAYVERTIWRAFAEKGKVFDEGKENITRRGKPGVLYPWEGPSRFEEGSTCHVMMRGEASGCLHAVANYERRILLIA